MRKEEIYAGIGRMFTAGRVPHAIFLVSDELDAARDIAASIVCREKTFPACGRCPACMKSQRRVHPDVRVIEAEKDTITVEQVRRLRADAYVKPNDGDARVFIIPGASRMTPQAQNALLKVLEQPPAGVTFLLCDRRADGILETLRSRLVTFSFTEASEPDGGGFDRAAPLLEAAVRGQAHGVYEAAAAACKTREQAVVFGESLLRALRDLMLLREAPGRVAVAAPAQARELARSFGTGALIKMYDLAQAALISVENAGNIGLATAAFAAGIQEELF